MIGMILLLTVVTKNFLSYNNILNVLSTISINGCIALGMCIVITAGGIDLTVGALLAWGSVVARSGTEIDSEYSYGLCSSSDYLCGDGIDYGIDDCTV